MGTFKADIYRCLCLACFIR